MSTVNRNDILEMLAAGKITAQEAIDLLDGKEAKAFDSSAVADVGMLKAEEEFEAASDALPADVIKSSANPSADPFKIRITEDDVLVKESNGQRPRWLKIRVRDLETGHNKVKVTLPLGLVSFGLGIARRFGADFDDDQNISEMWQMIKEGERGVLVDVEDAEDNEQVQIYLD